MNNANALQNSTVTVNTNNSLLFNFGSGTIATFNVGGLSGSGNISLADGGPLALSLGGNGASTTYSGALSGSGGLTKTGTGILTLAGVNTYSGSTTLTAGELSISASNNLSANSPVLFNGGILQITGTAVTGLGNIPVNWSAFNGGFDIANAANVFTLGNAVSGTGSLSKLGPGTLLLTASNNAYGNTTISAGTLQVGGAGSLGTGPVTDNAALVFNLSGNPTYSGLISGTGGLTQMGTGTLTLTGSNTYTGGTTVSAGTLEVGNGGSGEFLASSSVSLGNGCCAGFQSVRLADV